MNEDLNKKIEGLTRKITELENWKKSLEMSHSIPLEIEQSFKARFKTLTQITLSTKDAGSEGKTVREGGSNNYSVLNNPDAFLQMVIGNTTYYIPVFQ